MTLPVPASDACLRVTELLSGQTAPNYAKMPDLVQDLISDRYNGKLEELKVRSLTRSSTSSSTSTVFTSESGVDLDYDVSTSVESSTSTSDDDSDSSSESASIPLGRPYRFLAPVYPPTFRTAADEKDKVSVATKIATYLCCCCCWNKNQSRNTNQSRKTNQSQEWPRQGDLNWKANEIFLEYSRMCKEAVQRRRSEENDLRSSVDDIFDTMQDIYKDRPLDQLCKTEFTDLFIDAHLTNKLQILPYNKTSEPRFLIFNSLKISEIEIDSTKRLPPNTRTYTIGVVATEDRFCKTEVVKRDSEHVVFRKELDFERLPYNFGIRLQFFQFRVKEKRRSSMRFLKWWGEKPIKFKFICEAKISREHLVNGRLLHVYKGARGRGHFSIEAKLTAQVRSQLKLEEYLYYASNENNSMVGWSCNRRWCELEDTCIKMWMFHEMKSEPPVKCIDLTKANCVRRALPHENPRQYSMVIEIVDDFKVNKIYLAHNKEEGIDLWIEIIRIVKNATESFKC